MTRFPGNFARIVSAYATLKAAALAAALFVSCLAGAPAGAGDIRFLTLEEPPTNYLEDGKIVGTTVDLVREMARLLGEIPEIDFLPPARAFLLAQSTPDRMLFTAAFTPEREALGYRAIGPVISRRHLLYARKGSNLKITDVEDLVAQGLTISGMDADWRTAFLKDAGAVVETTPEHLLNLKKLVAERTDLWISSDIEAPAILAEAGVDPSAVEVAYVLRTAPSYILVSKGTEPDRVARWRGAFEALSTDADFLERMTAKWSGKLDMELGFAPAKGFFVKAAARDDTRS
ncbi:substrate-binding periplasmic protein [Roseibium sediminicola]|uniref:Transporter substrate-binding domain-containing protein n=1 Tax=Roseibium sediminicola TaxID=2933272 RepID=A0ABT0GTC3_9HYPH|nr:transporter substrate-binding domain-containing protein [Roseibium sp. CAU 1639]MCK7612696.1 transporter substrate-binding domain-containing protein [Roseibium sp. CAU 1639]